MHKSVYYGFNVSDDNQIPFSGPILLSPLAAIRRLHDTIQRPTWWPCIYTTPQKFGSLRNVLIFYNEDNNELIRNTIETRDVTFTGVTGVNPDKNVVNNNYRFHFK